MELILASGSARRRELLENCGYDFRVIPCTAEENVAADTPARLVEELALLKADTVFSSLSPEDRASAVVLGSDTVVVLDGEVIGKPHSAEEAKEILRRESGRVNTVYTGVAVVTASGASVEHDKASVSFKTLTDEEISAYIATGEPMDKAGAYGIQGRFSLFITGVSGSYFTVVGLPVHLLYPMLAEAGVYPRWMKKQTEEQTVVGE